MARHSIADRRRARLRNGALPTAWFGPLRVFALLCLAVALVWLAAPRPAIAENRATIRGNYYRERSTRVVQPMAQVTVDAPDERLTLGATYLLDAVSSASIASGTQAATGGDNVFHELRHEATGTVGSRLGEWNLGGFFRYSTETDYISRAGGLSLARDLLQRNINVGLSYSFSGDRWYRIQNNTGDRRPWCGGDVSIDECRTGSRGANSNFLQVHNVAAGYTHTLHRTVLALFNVSYSHLRGPLDNPYREGFLGGIEETHPHVRDRVVMTPSVRWMIPKWRTTFEPFYSFYVDSWGQRAHTPEIRVHFRPVRHVRLRARYSYYTQTAAFFYRADGQYVDGDGKCTRAASFNCATADVKAMPWDAHTPGIQLTWDFDGVAARRRALRWLEGGFIELTYNHLFQDNRFGNARIGSIAVSFTY